jgi:tetratricopeptide (TPR) repeat protein
VALHSPPPRVANIYLYETLMTLGRYQEAWGVMTGSAEQVAFLPHHQKALAGIDNLTLARICLEIGQPQDAWGYWQAGAAAFIDDPKMGPYVRSLGAAVQAHLGMADDARKQIRYVAEVLDAKPLPRGSKLDNYAYLIRAASLLGDHGDCLRFLERYRELKPYVADFPRTLYYAGESCFRAGDRDGAMSRYREAASACPESIYAEHALTRLSEMGVSAPSFP